MLKSTIADGTGESYEMKVNKGGEIEAVIHTHPPLNEDVQTLPFRSYFKDTAGALDMRVDGSATNVLFSINADKDFDIYIKSISVVIADAGATLNNFGNIGALTNGLEFYWETQQDGRVVIHESLKTNFDFVRLANGQPAFGTGNSAFRANNIVGTSEAFFMTIDLTSMASEWGMRLRKGTKDTIVFKVKDDVTGIDGFDCIAYGIKI